MPRQRRGAASGGIPPAPAARRIRIIHEDSDIVVVEKPAGILSVPLDRGRSPNALEILEKILERKRRRPLTVHRIDRYTSGLLLFALNPRAKEVLISQFKDRSAERRYLALLTAPPQPAEGTLRHHLRQGTRGFRQQVHERAVEGSSVATLRYRTREVFGEGALVEVELESGFKNQIRAQFAAIGCALIGDRAYGTPDDRLPRQALHATELAFDHPRNRERVRFMSPLPHDLERLIKSLRRQR